MIFFLVQNIFYVCIVINEALKTDKIKPLLIMENKKVLTTKEALLEVMSRPKWYVNLPRCTPQLAYYYKTQAKAGTLSEQLTSMVLEREFTKNAVLWIPKDLKPLETI